MLRASALLWLLAAVARAAEDEVVEEVVAPVLEEKGVLVLTDANFAVATADHKLLLVEFYAPWCGHCQELAPEYEKAAAILANGESKIRLGKVDATVEEVVAAKFQVDGFPTLKFFRDGVPSEYGGPRQAQGIADWLVKKTGPQFTVANSKAELDLVLEEKGILAVGFFADPESEAAEVFKEVAAGQDDVDFFIISSAAVMAEYHRTDSSILVLKTFDDTEVHFAETLTKENLQKFIEKSARPLVTEFTQENAAKIFGSGIMHHFLLLSGKKEPEFGSSMENVKEVAKEYRDQMTFVHLDVEEEEHNGIIEFFGLTKDQFPTFAIFEMESSSKYLPTADKAKQITVSNIRGFVKDYFGGKLQKYLKSQPLPEDWNSGPVVTLVTENFDKIANDKAKDVFVKFYAPWCGHCKAIAPIWDEIGAKYSESVDLVIARVDSTKNEIDGVEVDGFPTLKMFKKGTNEAVDYVGKRDLEHMVKFIETGEQEEDEDRDVNEEEDDEFDEEDFDEEEDEDDKSPEQIDDKEDLPHDEL